MSQQLEGVQSAKSQHGDPNQHQYLKVEIKASLENFQYSNLSTRVHLRCSLIDDKHAVLQRIGKTESLMQQNKMSFLNPLYHDYLFQKSQIICFSIHDEKQALAKEGLTSSALDQEFLSYHSGNFGIINIDCADMIQAGMNGIIRDIPGSQAKIVLTAKILNPLHSFKINLIVKGTDFDKKDFPLTTNAYYQLFAKGVKIAQSPVCPNAGQKPSWKEIVFSGSFLDQRCHEFVFKVWDRVDLEDDDYDELIGECIVPIGDLTHNFDPAAKHLIKHPKKTYKKKRPHSGKLIIEDFTMIKQPEFFGLLQSGLEFRYHCAVDFTASNGPFDDKGSNHFSNPELKELRNQYSDCIQAVGNIVTAYDYEKEIRATAFGARLEGEVTSNDYFPLNRKKDNPVCHGITEVLDSYFDCRSKVHYANPTNICETIQNTKEIAGRTRHHAIYHVLLILIDSEISDMLKVLAELKKCEDEPISVIFIGIGICPFDQMAKLTEEQSGNKIKRKRNLVQFSKYNNLAFQFSNKNNEKAEHKISTHISEMLAGELLKNLPRQVEEYFLLMELECHNIQRRLSPSEPAMLVDPSEMRIVRGPLEANASYGQVVKSPYAIGRSTGKELIPIDVLLAGFSNPTMAGYDHYVTVQSRNKCPTVTDKDDMVYDKDLKTAFDPNYLENLYEMQEHKRNTKGKLNKGGNLKSATHKIVLDYVENPFDNKHKDKQGPRINVNINKQTVIIDPNTKSVYAQGPKLASNVKATRLTEETQPEEVQCAQQPEPVSERKRETLQSESKDSGTYSPTQDSGFASKTPSVAMCDLTEDQLKFSSPKITPKNSPKVKNKAGHHLVKTIIIFICVF